MDNEKITLTEEEEDILPIHFVEDDEVEETDESYMETYAKKLAAMSNENLKVLVDDNTAAAVDHAEKLSKRHSFAIVRRIVIISLLLVGIFLAAFFLFHDYNVDDNGDGIKISQFDGTFVKMYVTVPEQIDGKTVNEIGSSAFFHCGQLRTVSIPGTVKKIGSSAFAECHWLRKVTLNEGLEEIGSKCFASVSELHKITIPKSVKTIGSQAFDSVTITVTAPHEPEYYGYTPDENVTWEIEE